MPTFGWEQKFYIELSPQDLATLSAHPCIRVEDLKTQEILFSNLDLPRNVFIATTAWPDRERFIAALQL